MSKRSAKRSVVLVLAFITFTAALVGVSEARASEDRFSGAGTVNSIEADAKKINLTHDPIPALGWPAMTMDFLLADGVTLEGIAPGAKISFQLRKRSDGAYEIESLSLAEE